MLGSYGSDWKRKGVGIHLKKKLLRRFISSRSSPHTMRTPVNFFVFGSWSLAFYQETRCFLKSGKLLRFLERMRSSSHTLWEHPLYFWNPKVFLSKEGD